MTRSLIDLLALDDTSKRLVALIFAEYIRPFQIKKSGCFSIGTHELIFNQHMYRYPLKKRPSEVGYGIVGKELGAGAFGTVFLITHTLKLDDNNNVILKAKNPDKMRVVKVYCGNFALIYARNERKILERLPLMHVKVEQANFLGRKTLASLFMRYFPGIRLDDYIRAHQNGLSPLTAQQLLVAGRVLFTSLYEQVHLNGVVHQDIKMENIMVQVSSDNTVVSANIIDFNLAKLQNDLVCFERRGTWFYAAPEAWQGQYSNYKSDIYSMNRILWHLGGLPVDFDENVPDADYKSLVASYENPDSSSLPDPGVLSFMFKTIPESDMSASCKLMIRHLCWRMNAMCQEDRPEYNEIFSCFDRMMSSQSARQRAGFFAPRLPSAMPLLSSNKIRPGCVLF